MVHVETFGSMEEMYEALQERARIAHEGMHAAQAGIAWGAYWCRFIDVAANSVEFGHVYPREKVALEELTSGASWEDTLAVVAATAEDLVGNALMYGIAYSKENPTGDIGHTHKANVWPIEKRLFDAAQKVDFDIERLDDAMKLLLEVAYRSQRTHVMTSQGSGE